MKRVIVYNTQDGKQFPDRRQAAAHETNIVRVARITEFLVAKLPQKSVTKEQLDLIANTIGENAIDFSELISARATRRFLAKGGNVVPAPVGKRPRGAVAAKVGSA